MKSINSSFIVLINSLTGDISRRWYTNTSDTEALKEEALGLLNKFSTKYNGYITRSDKEIENLYLPELRYRLTVCISSKSIELYKYLKDTPEKVPEEEYKDSKIIQAWITLLISLCEISPTEYKENEIIVNEFGHYVVNFDKNFRIISFKTFKEIG